MTITIPVYSEQELSPRAAEVIRKILDDSFGAGIVRFREATSDDELILVFGNKTPNCTPYGRKYIFTYSVAQIMTKPNAASVLTAGVKQCMSEPEPIPFLKPVGDYFLNKLARLDFSRPTAIDIETSGLLGETHTPEEVDIISVAFYQQGCPPVVVHGVWDSINNKSLGLSAPQIKRLAECLPQFEYAIYHNGKFDIRVMNRVFGINLVNSFDTMLAHHVLNHAAGDHKLKTLARRLVGAPEWEADLKKYTKKGGHYELIPLDKLVEYNGWDVYWTYKLWELFSPQIEADDNNVMAFGLEMAAAQTLLDVEMYGIPYDTSYAATFRSKHLASAETDLHWMRVFADDDKFNPNSPKQVRDLFELTFGLDLPKTDEDTLNKLVEMHPITGALVQHLLNYRKHMKIIRTYVDGWQKHERNGRVHPTFNVHGTTTGRLSSSSPNAQNMPRDKAIRKLVSTFA